MSIWDEKTKETLRIDLWTKDIRVDEMKHFFHQTLHLWQILWSAPLVKIKWLQICVISVNTLRKKLLQS